MIFVFGIDEKTTVSGCWSIVDPPSARAIIFYKINQGNRLSEASFTELFAEFYEADFTQYSNELQDGGPSYGGFSAISSEIACSRKT